LQVEIDMELGRGRGWLVRVRTGGACLHFFESIDGGETLVEFVRDEEVAGLVEGLGVEDVDEGVAEGGDIGCVIGGEQIVGGVDGVLQIEGELLVFESGAKASQSGMIDGDAEALRRWSSDEALDVSQGMEVVLEPADEDEALSGGEGSEEGASAEAALVNA
jgi:hypothetical protein